MDVSLSFLFPEIYIFTTGRRIVAMQQVRAAAVGLNYTPLVTHADSCVAYDRSTLVVEALWNGRDTSTAVHPELREVDLILDPLATSLRDTIDGQVRGSKPGDALAEVGAKLLHTLFPMGVAAITHASYPDEAAEIERILDEVKKPEWAAVVVAFGLTRLIERMQEVMVKYRELLDTPITSGLKYADVKATRATGQTLMLQTFSLALAKYPSDSAEDLSGRETLLRPILRQNEAIGQYLKNRRTVPDVNPETGDEVAVPGT